MINSHSYVKKNLVKKKGKKTKVIKDESGIN